MRSRKGVAPPQSAPPANPQPAAQVAPKAVPPKTTAPVGKPVPATPSEPVKRAAPAQAPAAQAATAKPTSSPAKPVPLVQAKPAPQPPARQPPLEPVKVQRPAPASPASPTPFNHFPRAAAPVQKAAQPTTQSALPTSQSAPSAPVSRRTAENPAPRAAPAVQSVKGRPMVAPTPQAQALPGRATQVPTNAPAMPASVRQSAQAPSAAPPLAAAPPVVKRPLGRPRKAAPLTPADVADIVQADLPSPSKPGRSFGTPSAPLAAKQHQALCAYSAQVKTLATEAEIAAAAQALGADDLVVLRQVDRLRRLGGHNRTLCATDDAAVDRLTRAGLVVVLPWNGPKPPEPACYAELTPAGAAVIALLPQPPRSAAQESEETTKTLQRYTEPRKTGRPPGKG